jgi:predicted Zn-ribbon and HTH transcriptional regulator
MVVRPELKNEPYCGNCGYVLTGATETSKCPECGRPLVEVLTRNTAGSSPSAPCSA